MIRSLAKNTPSTLIATLGTEPQVVTACLDLLLDQGEAIEEVVVVYTPAAGAAITDSAAMLRLAFEQPPYAGQILLNLVPFTDPEGRPLEDVQTPEETRAAFRFLYNLVRLRKQQAGRLHLCIAGGRKTLALFGMACAQLLFDERDRLWHLYSGGDFLASKRLHPLPGDEAHLIPIPLILWSQVSPALSDLSQVEDPWQAAGRIRQLQLTERMQQARGFVLGSLSEAERRVVALLVEEGLSDNEISRAPDASAVHGWNSTCVPRTRKQPTTGSWPPPTAPN